MVRPPEKPLYKYTQRKWAEALARDGAIHLGTLYGFRAMEGILGDAGEGKETRYDNPAVTRAADLPSFGADILTSIIPNAGGGMVFDHCIFADEGDSPNFWTFCTSATHPPNRAILKRMSEAYDACVRIDFPGLFSRIIANELIRRDLIAGHGSAEVQRCVYRSRTRYYLANDGVPRYAIRELGDGWLNEVRSMFLPRVPIAAEESIDLALPNLTRCCRLVEIPE